MALVPAGRRTRPGGSDRRGSDRRGSDRRGRAAGWASARRGPGLPARPSRWPRPAGAGRGCGGRAGGMGAPCTFGSLGRRRLGRGAATRCRAAGALGEGEGSIADSHDGEPAFACAASGLAANMCGRSEPTRALVLGQRHEHKGFMDLLFFDDGVTIPVSLEPKVGGNPAEVACAALGGASAEGNARGFGPGTTLNPPANGLGSDFFIAPGAGAACGGKEAATHGGTDGVLPHELPGAAKIDGTPITADAVQPAACRHA